MNCQDLLRSEKLLGFLSNYGSGSIIKCCYSEPSNILSLLLSNNLIVNVLLNNSIDGSDFCVKSFVLPLDLIVTDFDLSSGGKYCVCVSSTNFSQLIICPAQALFAEVQVNGPWSTKNVSYVDFIPAYYSEIEQLESSPVLETASKLGEASRVVGGTTSGVTGVSANTTDFSALIRTVAVGWFHVGGRDLAVVVHEEHAVSIVDLREQLTIAKGSMKAMLLSDTLFIKHENRVLVKTNESQWYGFCLDAAFQSSLSKIAWTKGSSSGSSAGSGELAGASIKTSLASKLLDFQARRDNFKKRSSADSRNSQTFSQLIALKPTYYQQFDELQLNWAHTGAPKGKIIIARKRQELRLFTTVLDPNYCSRYSLKLLVATKTAASTSNESQTTIKTVKKLFVHEFFAVVQLQVSSSALPLVNRKNAGGVKSEVEIHFLKFLGSSERPSIVASVNELRPGEDILAVYQLGFHWHEGEESRPRSSSLVSSDPNDNVDPLASFLIVTTQSVHVVFQHKSPELIALRFGCNQMLEQMIDICVALRVNNLKPICNFLSVEMLKRRKYEYALRLFATADMPLYSQLDMFCEHGALDSAFDYFRKLFLKRVYPEKESKLFAEIIINCYIQQICTCVESKATQYSSELSEILRDNFNYTEEIVLRVLLENEMLSLFCQVASQRGLVSLSLSMLANFDDVSISADCVSAFTAFGLIEDYLNYEDGLFLNQLTLTLLLNAISSNVKLALACRNYVLAGMQKESVSYYDCFRIATLFNPSKEDTILAIGELAKSNSNFVDLDATYTEMTSELTISGNLSPNQGQSIDKDMFEKKLQSDLIKDTCGIFIKALLIMRQLRQNADEQGKEIDFRSEYIYHVAPNPLSDEGPEASLLATTRAARASRSTTLELVSTPVHKPMKRRLAASSDHLGVITVGGNLYMMGSTACGKLGVGELVMQTEYHKALCVETLHMFSLKVKSIACGHMHTLCLTSRGIYSWGSNRYGQLGLGHQQGPGQLDDDTIVTKPMPVPLFNQEKATQISCGDYHSLVCTRSPRKVYAFGWGVFGQLGTGSSENCFKPKEVRLPPNTNVISLNGGKTHSTLLTEYGHVYAWGSNRAGQIGIFDGNVNKSTEPVLVKFFNETATVLQTKGFVNIIATSSGRIIKFGCDPNKMQIYISRVKSSRANSNVKPDTLYSEEYFKTPREIMISANVQEDPVVDFSLGNCHILCLLQSGQVFGCGRNESCQLALPSSNVVNESFFPLSNVPFCTYVTALKDTSIAIGEDNRCYLWGKVHSGVVEPMHDSVEELHNGFFCISDPTAIAEIPHDDFRRPKEDDDMMQSPIQAVSPEPSPDHKFLANSITRADWSIESLSSANFGNSNPLARLSGLPQLSEVVEVDGWRFGPNVIYRSIDLLKNYYRFNDVLRMGVKHHFWAFCRNLCALHGYYVRAFIYDLKDLESEVEAPDSPDSTTTTCSPKLAEGFFCGLQTALENVTELMREDRFNAWRGLLTAALAFIHKWNVPTDNMETILNSYVEKLEFAGAFHAVLFEMLLDDQSGQSDSSNPSSSTADYICSLLSPSFLLNTIESTFTQRHEVLKGLYHGTSIKNWSKKKTTELTKFVRELHDDDISKEKKQKTSIASSSLPSVQISTQSLLNAMDGYASQSTVTVFSCGHVTKSALQDVCRYCN